jgi:chromosome segregation ATPase
MKRLLWTASALLVLAATTVSCDKIKPPQPEVQQPPSAASEQAKPSAEREAFAQAAQNELDELQSAIAGLKIKAESANVEVKAKLGEELEKLEGEWREAQQRLTELKSATIETWSEVKESFSKSLDKLKIGIENSRKHAA